MVPPVGGSQAALSWRSGIAVLAPGASSQSAEPLETSEIRREAAGGEDVDCVLETQASPREPASQGLPIRYERVGN